MIKRLVLAMTAAIMMSACAGGPKPVTNSVKFHSEGDAVPGVMADLVVSGFGAQVCLKRNEHYYCGKSYAVTKKSSNHLEKDINKPVLIEDWQLGSLFIKNQVVFVVVDEEGGKAWTLPVPASENDESGKSAGLNAATGIAPKPSAGYHCDCPEFRKAFAAAAMMATF